MPSHKTLVFLEKLSGHYWEYTHHSYQCALKNPHRRFVFVLRETERTLLDENNFPPAANIEIKCFPKRAGNERTGIAAAWLHTRELARWIKSERPGRVVLFMPISFMPFLAFMPVRCPQINGVIYNIYLYRWKNSGLLTRAQDTLKYLLFSRAKRFARLFILNDRGAAAKLNRIYKTKKFRWIADPFAGVDCAQPKTLCSELGVQPGQKVFLHFGAMTQRKGTLDILDAILISAKTSLKDMHFIFAGKILNDIREAFYKKVAAARTLTNIHVYDQRVPFSQLASLLQTCHCIVIPYKNVHQSSGALAYAAQYKKPLIAPADGLLGKLIRRNHLGLTLPVCDAEALRTAFSQDLCKYFDKNKAQTYLQDIDAERFAQALLGD